MDNATIEELEVLEFIIFFAVIFIYLFFASILNKKKMKKEREDYREKMKLFHDTENNNKNRHSYMYQDIEKEIIKVDHTFSKEVFLNNAKELFLKYHNALVKEECEELKKYLTEDFYNTVQNRINENKLNNIKVVLEKIYIYNAFLYEFSKSTDNQLITVKLKTELKTYEINYKTQYITKENKYASVDMNYDMQFERKTKDLKCQNCGAPVNTKDLSVCEYCNSPIQLEDNDWKLNYINRGKELFKEENLWD